MDKCGEELVWIELFKRDFFLSLKKLFVMENVKSRKNLNVNFHVPFIQL